MEVDRHADRALYLQLADVLRHDITEGRLRPGERLPSENELIDRHGVSRGTVREAVGVLRNEGVVVVEHGRGAFVRSTDQQPLTRTTTCAGPHLGVREAFEHAAHDRGASPSIRQIADPGGEPLPADVAGRLGIANDASPTVVLCFSDGRPAQLSRVWRSPRSEDASGEGLNEEISARMPTREERRLLQLDDGAPVLTLTRHLLHRPDLVEYSSSVLAAGRQRLTYAMECGDVGPESGPARP